MGSEEYFNEAMDPIKSKEWCLGDSVDWALLLDSKGWAKAQ